MLTELMVGNKEENSILMSLQLSSNLFANLLSLELSDFRFGLQYRISRYFVKGHIIDML